MSRYSAISEVPRRWRSIKGGSLTLDQIETIVSTAEESELPFGEAIAQARRDFEASHSLKNGFWIEGGDA